MSRRGPLSRAEAERRLAELYAQIPEIRCRGLCSDNCTVIDASGLEHTLAEEAGVPLPHGMHHLTHLQLLDLDVHQRCPALGPLNTCTIYAKRPLICRLWGAARGMLCGHGCLPERILERPEGMALLVAASDLSKAAGYGP